MNNSQLYRIHHTSKVLLIEDVQQVKLYQQDKLLNSIERDSEYLTNSISPHMVISELKKDQWIQLFTPTHIWSISYDTLDMYLLKERTTQGYPLYVQHGEFSIQILTIKLGSESYLYARVKMKALSKWERILTQLKKAKPYKKGQWLSLKRKGLIVGYS